MNTDLIDAAELVATLRGFDTVGYGGRPIPVPLDSAMTALISRYRALPVDQRTIFRESLQVVDGRALSAYAERMASLAVRTGSLETVLSGVIALGLSESTEEDWRETVMVLSVLFRSVEKLGGDPRELFRTAGRVLNAGAAAHLLLYTRRAPENRQIEVMGYVETIDESGFIYKKH